MACYHPWRMPGGDGQVLPCGQCRGCRSAYHRDWSMRCMHEAQMQESEGRSNSFVTLTYDDEHLPPGGSLAPEDFVLWMKRLRKSIEPARVRYYMCGEYGENSNRPHYHALLFGHDFSDKTVLSVRKGFPVFTSERLRETWQLGLHEIGSVTPASAAYVTRYITKRMTGSWAKAKYKGKVPEYGQMSRNPGIGAGWIDKYKCEVYPSDGVVVRGRLAKPPRYYDARVSRSEACLVDDVKWKRFGMRKREEETPERLLARESVAVAEANLYRGGEL